jgi:RNA polymerase sigma-70 factor, ECF subfamily
MKHSSQSKGGSGVRARGEPLIDDKTPCTSFEEVHQRHGHFVLRRICEKLQSDPGGVDDVFQQVLIRVDRRIREGRCVPHPIVPVLLGIIADQVKNHRRARRRLRSSDDAPDSTVPASKPDPEQLLDGAERRAEVRQAVEAVFARMRTEEVELIKLALTGEVSQKEIAERMGVPEGTVSVKLHRARLKFAELYCRSHGPRRKP